MGWAGPGKNKWLDTGPGRARVQLLVVILSWVGYGLNRDGPGLGPGRTVLCAKNMNGSIKMKWF